ncbi:hypothetical protein [Afifella sp. IM 167]|uniref:sodium:solute symporter family transporter n=1 Tax=Afifella sp. IM 167 TaxID=2033586 RepID=UPI001CCADFBB
MKQLPPSIATDAFAAHPRTVWGFFLAVLAGLVLLMIALEELGTPEPMIGLIILVGAFASYLCIGVVAGTTQSERFLIAGGAVPAGYNGMAAAAAFLSGAWFLAYAGTFAAWGLAAWTLAIGAALGLGAGGFLLAGPMRRAEAVTTADFLAIRTKSRAVRLAASLLVLAGSFMLLAVVLAGIGELTASVLALPPSWSVTAAAVLLALMLVPGGMRSATWTQVAQYLVMTVAFLAPVAIVAAERFGWPIPQLALPEAAERLRALAAADPGLANLARREDLFGSFTPGDLAATLVLSALFAFALPHVLERYLTAPSVASARRTSRWMLLFVGIILVTAPAYAALTFLDVIEHIVGVPLTALPDWVFMHGEAQGLFLCGQAAVSPEAISAACGGQSALAGVSLADVALSGRALVMRFAERSDLFFVFTTLLYVGAISAALSTASGLLAALTGTVSHDLQHKLIAPGAPMGKRLLAARASMIAAIALAALWAAEPGRDLLGLGFLALGLLAAGLGPVLFIAGRGEAKALPTLASMLAGSVTMIALFVAEHYGSDLVAGSGDEWVPPAFQGLAEVGIPSASTVFLAVLAALVALIVMQILPERLISLKRGRRTRLKITSLEEAGQAEPRT